MHMRSTKLVTRTCSTRKALRDHKTSYILLIRIVHNLMFRRKGRAGEGKRIGSTTHHCSIRGALKIIQSLTFNSGGFWVRRGLGIILRTAGEELCTVQCSLVKLYMPGRPDLEGQRVFNVPEFYPETRVDHSHQTYVHRLSYLYLSQFGSPTDTK